MFASVIVSFEMPEKAEKLLLYTDEGHLWPAMPIPAWVLLGFGLLVFTLAFFSLLKKFPALLTVCACWSYLPLAYVFHWMIYRYNEEARAEKPLTKLEFWVRQNMIVFDWVLLVLCYLFALVFFIWAVWWTISSYRKKNQRRDTAPEPEFEDEPANRLSLRSQPAGAARGRPPERGESRDGRPSTTGQGPKRMVDGRPSRRPPVSPPVAGAAPRHPNAASSGAPRPGVSPPRVPPGTAGGSAPPGRTAGTSRDGQKAPPRPAHKKVPRKPPPAPQNPTDNPFDFG